MNTILKVDPLSFHSMYHSPCILSGHHIIISEHIMISIFTKNNCYCFIHLVLSNPVMVLNERCLCWTKRATTSLLVCLPSLTPSSGYM